MVDVFVHTMFLSKSSMPCAEKFWWKRIFPPHLFFLRVFLGSLNLILWADFWLYCLIFFFDKPDKSYLFHWHNSETTSLGTVWNLALPRVQWRVLMEPVDEAQNVPRQCVGFHSPPGGPVPVHCGCHWFQMPESEEQNYALCFKVGGRFVQSQGPLDCEM